MVERSTITPCSAHHSLRIALAEQVGQVPAARTGRSPLLQMSFVYPTSALKSSFYRKVADQRRLTQDFPVLTDVWIEFAEQPGDRCELLLTP